MGGQNCVVPILVAVLIFHACGWTSVTEARDDADVMARLAVLEEGQRDSQAEIRALRETVADQKDTIDKQSMRLRTLEQDIITLKASQHRQVKRFQRAERLLQSLLNTNHSNTEAQENALYKAVLPSPIHSDDTVKESVNKRGGIRAALDRNVHPNVPKRQTPETVAFTFYLDHDVNPNAHTVIKFNKEITNEGNGYNNNTGVFTCPTGGMYLIYFSIGERDIHQQYCALMVNNRNIVDAVVEGFHATEDSQGGNTAAVRLNQGDSVWVESIYNNHYHLEGSNVLRLTSFTGVLLHP